jgi:integrase
MPARGCRADRSGGPAFTNASRVFVPCQFGKTFGSAQKAFSAATNLMGVPANAFWTRISSPVSSGALLRSQMIDVGRFMSATAVAISSECSSSSRLSPARQHRRARCRTPDCRSCGGRYQPREKSTERAYCNDWRDFCAFARLIGRAPHPAEPETVALYVTNLARRGRAPATIARRLVSIAVYHRAAGHPSPTEHGVGRAVVSGLRRQLGVAQQQKTALEIDPLRAVLARIPGDVRGSRDRALLLIGWAAALRRSELAALVVSDLQFEPDGLIIALRRSKTDQEATGEVVAVPFGAEMGTCPVRAVRAWLAVAGDDGAVFRRIDRHGNIGSNLTATAIASIIRARTAAAGIPVISPVIHCAPVFDGCNACRSKRGVDHAPRSMEKRSGRASLYS